MSYQVDENGFYGPYGGSFVPEVLFPNVAELAENYQDIMADPDFQNELKRLLHRYAGRETPLYPSPYLSGLYGASILLKREDLCHSGSHKINNTLGQVLLAKRLGKKRIVAETGAGSHGVATAMACALLKMPCSVYMGEVDMVRQFPNVERMRLLGAEVIPAVSGSKTLKDATNEAFRHWINNPEDTYYVIGSVVGPHPYPDMVARFQSVISCELLGQVPELTGKQLPDYVVACVGGGSNAAGSFYHFLDHPAVRLIAAEAAGKGLHSGFSAAATFLGKEGILHGTKTKFMQTIEGQVLEAHSISAGLDYPGIGPLHAYLHDTGRAEFVAVTDDEAMDAGIALSKNEGIIPAIESAHALAALAQLRLKSKDVVVVCLSGRGDKDLETYIQYSTSQKSES
ncbi:tryptophan synthase subunit beta [Dyadobacter sp. LHD-138]|uniref:tryptophan synthase subunit beta n=1 Tax=Dyadobacter sp. LHD-138 TaxID=3071413 RepID=UPI0027E1EBAB|nr:tryptophan synthase subunit beta [Dyadobacter sp. LHD-138]MDQ6480017.1 tryptophan synthase subunit beta [Dyadobacter sp. LHD-138]